MAPDEAKERIRLALESNLRIRRYLEKIEKLKASSRIDISSSFIQEIERINPSKTGPRLGSLNANVVIVEFSDFECYFCRQSYSIIKQVLDKYAGQVSLIYKFFPLNMNGKGMQSSKAAVCADRQNKFWQFHDVLFSVDTFSDKDLVESAKRLELNMEAFNKCFLSDDSTQEVMKNVEEGKRLKISGTPTFYINGRQFTGIMNFNEFSKIIDEEIALTTKFLSK